MRVLARSYYFLVTCDDDDRLVCTARTATQFPTVEAAEAQFQQLSSIASSMTGHVLLVDSRLGPGRNDPEYEQVLDRYRDRMFGPYARCAMLVRTQVGMMQSQRLLRARPVHVALFQDEALALAYLREGRR